MPNHNQESTSDEQMPIQTRSMTKDANSNIALSSRLCVLNRVLDSAPELRESTFEQWNKFVLKLARIQQLGDLLTREPKEDERDVDRNLWSQIASTLTRDVDEALLDRHLTTYSLYSKLKSLYMVQSQAALTRIHEDIESFKFGPTKDVDELVGKFRSLLQKLATYGEPMTEAQQRTAYLRAMKPHCLELRRRIDYDMCRNRTPSIREIQDLLIQYYRDNQQSQVVVNSVGQPKQRVQCNYCKKYGHKRTECRKRLAQQGGDNSSTTGGTPSSAPGGSQGGQANRRQQQQQPTTNNQPSSTSTNQRQNIQNVFSHGLIYMVDNAYASADTDTSTTASQKFMIDCGASQNIIHKDLLHDVRPVNKTATGIGDGRASIDYQGTLKLATESNIIYSADAYVSKDIPVNIFSNSIFTRNEEEIEVASNGTRTFTYQGDILGRSYLSPDGHHYADFRVVLPNIRILSLWHNRLAHFARDKIVKLARLNPKIEAPPSNFSCDECARCMVPRPAHITRSKTTEVLNMVHMDTTGRLEPSRNGCTSILVIKDEASSHVVTYPLKSKTEVADKVRSYITWAERQTGRKVKHLVHDNGTEFINTSMREMCESSGIVQLPTTVHEPSSNGLIERTMRTMKDKVRTLLSTAKLPTPYWEYAVDHLSYVINLIPRSYDDKVPSMLFSNTMPNITHLRAFGCKCFVLSNHRESTFNPINQEAIYLGVTGKGFKYIVATPTTGDVSIIESRNVVRFQEDNFPGIPHQSERDSLAEDWFEAIIQHHTPPPIAQPDPPPVSARNGRQAIPNRRIFNDDFITNFTIELEEKFLISTITIDGRIDIPTTIKQALSSNERAYWKDALDKEVETIIQHFNGLSPIPESAVDPSKIVDSRIVFSVKYDERNPQLVKQFKARWVAKGYNQDDDTYSETFAPVVHQTTIRLILVYALANKLELYHYDVVRAFLNTPLHEDVYIRPPKGLKLSEDNLFKLNKALYGLKQSARSWFNFLSDRLRDSAFVQMDSDPCIFMDKKRMVTIAIYVDDILLACPNSSIANDIFNELSQHFELSRTGDGTLNHFLGITFHRNDDTIAIEQSAYIKKLLRDYRCEDTKGRSSPGEYIHNDAHTKDTKLPCASLVGSLMYIATRTRPDILYTVRRLASYISYPNEQLWSAAKNTLKYLAQTIDYKLKFTAPTDEISLDLFTDASFASSYENEKSVTGIFVFAGGSPITWTSSSQQIASASAAESELYALTDGIKELIIADITAFELLGEIKNKNIFCDNTVTIAAIRDQPRKKMRATITRTKFAQDQILRYNFALQYTSTETQKADMLTKKFKQSFDLAQLFVT